MNSITVQPVNTISNLGLITSFHCEGSTGAAYQWQMRPHNGQYADIINPASQTDTLQYVPDTYEVYFRCVLTFPDTEILYSNEVEITPGTPANVGMFNGWYYSERYGGLNTQQRWYNINKLMNIFVNQWQWTPEAASGICGNIWAESGASPGSWEVWPQGGQENTGRGYGFVQWTAARTTIIPYANQYFPMVQWRNNGDIQVSRLAYEKSVNTEWVGFGGWNNVYSDKPPAEIADNFVKGYLRPTEAEYEASIRTRMRYAIMIFEQYKQLPLIPILKKLTEQGRRNL